MILSIGTVCVILLLLEFMRRSKSTERILPDLNKSGRIQVLDGLRGFLAMAVMFSHAASLRQYFQTGTWAWPIGQPWYKNTAEAAVALFFAITGYLFWGKAKRGGGKLAALELYTRRLWRIYPLYAFLMVSVFLICVLPHNDESLKATGLTVIYWLVPGLHHWGLLNGVQYGLFVTQSGTLMSEFQFYLIVPFVAWFAGTGRRFAVFASVFALGVVAALFRHKAGTLVDDTSNFFIGMAAAQCEGKKLKDLLSGTVGTVMIAVGIAGCAILPGAREMAAVPFIALIFWPIAYGNSLLGLLSLKASRLLGDVSYSIYLLHLLVLNVCVALVGRSARELSPMGWQVFTFAAAIVILFVALASYRLFEKPFMNGNPLTKKKKYTPTAMEVTPA